MPRWLHKLLVDWKYYNVRVEYFYTNDDSDNELILEGYTMAEIEEYTRRWRKDMEALDAAE